MEQFGPKLRALRQHEELTLQELAERLGYETHSYISEIESSKKSPTSEFVLKVSRFFGVSADSLLKDEVTIQQVKDEISG